MSRPDQESEEPLPTGEDADQPNQPAGGAAGTGSGGTPGWVAAALAVAGAIALGGAAWYARRRWAG